MKKRATPFAIVGTMLVPLLYAAPAVAQTDHSYVSKSGADGNSCADPSNACLTIGGALGKTNDGGTISILGGDYLESLVLTKGVVIRGDAAAESTIQASGAGSTAITFNGSPSQTLTLVGVRVDHGTGGAVGIQFNSGNRLQIFDSKINQFSNLGLNFVPNTKSASGSGSPFLLMENVLMAGNTNGHILVAPTNGVGATVLLDNVRTRYGLYGLRLDNSSGSGKIKANAVDGYVVHDTNNGYLAVGTGEAQVTLMIDRVTIKENGAYGAVATGAQAFMIVSGSTITHNGTGLAQLSGSTVATYTDNNINFNTTNTSGTITAITKK